MIEHVSVLSRYLLHEPANITETFTKQLILDAGVNKTQLCSYVTHFICAHCLSSNVWFFERIKMHYEELEQCKNSDKVTLTKISYNLFHLLACSEKKNYVFCDPQDKPDMFRSHILNIMESSNVTVTHQELEQLRDLLHQEVYLLLNIIFDNLMYTIDVTTVTQKCLLTVRYILTLPARRLYKPDKKSNLDAADIMFILFVVYGNHSSCPKHLSDYITLIKDLYYFKLLKKDKIKRANLIFYTLYTIISKSVYFQALDYNGLQIDNQKPNASNASNTSNTSKTKDIDTIKNKIDDDKCKYLFCYTELDERLSYEVRLERERSQIMSKVLRTPTKDIELDTLLMREPKDYIQVAKLGFSGKFQTKT